MLFGRSVYQHFVVDENDRAFEGVDRRVAGLRRSSRGRLLRTRFRYLASLWRRHYWYLQVLRGSTA